MQQHVRALGGVILSRHFRKACPLERLRLCSSAEKASSRNPCRSPLRFPENVDAWTGSQEHDFEMSRRRLFYPNSAAHPPPPPPRLVNNCSEAVKKGNKVFGAAVLKLSDLSLVAVGTNTEIECPLWHGEVRGIESVRLTSPSAPRIRNSHNLSFLCATHCKYHAC